ncbi:MAG: benzoate 1,2-dioxygenase electron transfer component BenC [Haloechinothrix sp.]
MNHQIALSFEDGITRFVRCGEYETVADAAYRARVNIPLDCRDGACGTCKSLCESGEYDGGDYIEEALSDDEATQGYALPCQMMPRTDLVLQIPGTSEMAKTQAATYTATITEIERHSDTTVGFTLEIDDRTELAFLPGQYVTITVPGSDVARPYSFSTGPAAEHASFLVRITEGGVMSGYLRDRASVGDRVAFTGPMGSFFLRDRKRPALFLAGGTGLAPLLSMLAELEGGELEHPVHLIYGVSRDADLVELDKLHHFVDVLPGFTFDYCVSDPASRAPNKGYVTDLFEPKYLNDGDVDIYLCGPPTMVEGVRGHLAESGLAPASFYHEKFAVSAAAGESR